MDSLSKIRMLVTHEIELLQEENEGTRVTIGCIIENIRRIFTKKNGNEMAFITLSDEKGLIAECIIFPRIFEQYKNLLLKDSVVVVSGKIDTKNDKPIIIAEKISSFTNFSS